MLARFVPVVANMSDTHKGEPDAALFMTFYVMAPTFDRAWETGVQPLMKNEISEEEAYLRITDPFREFMLAHVRQKDLQTFEADRKSVV